MNKKIKKLLKKLVQVNPYYVGVLAVLVSLIMGGGFILSPAVGVSAFFSWRIFVGDIKKRKVDNWDVLGLLLGGGLMYLGDASFELSIIRPVIVFLIGWGMFQLFEGDIGGGDVRLATVIAVFLNTVQLLSAISLAAAAGMLIGARLKMKTVPFGSLLIVASWLSFWIVRF